MYKFSKWLVSLHHHHLMLYNRYKSQKILQAHIREKIQVNLHDCNRQRNIVRVLCLRSLQSHQLQRREPHNHMVGHPVQYDEGHSMKCLIDS